MDSFPGVGWFEAFADRLQPSADFQTYCRWFRGTLAFVVDRRPVTMTFDRGLISGVAEGYSSPDVAIIGTSADWDCLLHQDQTLLRLYRSARMELRGENTVIMYHWKAIFWICQGMKSFAESAA